MKNSLHKSRPVLLFVGVVFAFLAATTNAQAGMVTWSVATSTTQNAVCSGGNTLGVVDYPDGTDSQCVSYCQGLTAACCTIETYSSNQTAPTNVQYNNKRCTARAGTATIPQAAQSTSTPITIDYSEGEVRTNNAVYNDLAAFSITPLRSADGFWSDQTTMDRACSDLLPGSGALTWGYDDWTSPSNNYRIYFNGSQWLRQQAGNATKYHLTNYLTCRVPSTTVKTDTTSWKAVLYNYAGAQLNVGIVANPSTVSSGQAATLTWAAVNAPTGTTCTGTNFTIPGGATNGSVNVNPLTSTSYTVTCSNSSYAASSTVKVNVANVLSVSCQPLVTSTTAGTKVEWMSTVNGGLRPYTYTWTNATGTPSSGSAPNFSATSPSTGTRRPTLKVVSAAGSGTPVKETFKDITNFDTTGMCSGSMVASNTITIPATLSNSISGDYAKQLCDANTVSGQCCDVTVARHNTLAQTQFTYRIFSGNTIVNNTRTCPASNSCTFYAGNAQMVSQNTNLSSPFASQTVTASCSPLTVVEGSSVDATALQPSLYSGSNTIGSNVTFRGYVYNNGNKTFGVPLVHDFWVDRGNNGTVDLHLTVTNGAPDLNIQQNYTCGGTVLSSGVYPTDPYCTGQLQPDQTPIYDQIANACRTQGVQNGQCCSGVYTCYWNGNQAEPIEHASIAIKITSGSVSQASPACYTSSSGPSGVTESDCYAGVRQPPQLAPGEAFPEYSPVWSNLPQGKHRICFVADQNASGVGALAEVDETNNVSPCLILSVGPPPITGIIFTAGVGSRTVSTANEGIKIINVRKGDNTVFTWNCGSGATACTLKGPNGLSKSISGGTMTASGNQTISITAGGNYILTTSTADYTEVRTIQVKIVPAYLNI